MRRVRGGRCPLWKDRDVAVDREDGCFAVVELDVLRAATDVRRIDLERYEEDQRLAGGDVAEPVRDPAITVGLGQGLRRDAVHGVTLRPAGVEDEECILNVLARCDVETRRVDDPATRACGRVDLQRRTRRYSGRRLRPLAEEVEEASDKERRQEGEQEPPSRNPPLSSFHVPV